MERVLKNRESAMKSLQKKKVYTMQLEQSANVLQQRNDELRMLIKETVERIKVMGQTEGVEGLEKIEDELLKGGDLERFVENATKVAAGAGCAANEGSANVAIVQSNEEGAIDNNGTSDGIDLVVGETEVGVELGSDDKDLSKLLEFDLADGFEMTNIQEGKKEGEPVADELKWILNVAGHLDEKGITL